MKKKNAGGPESSSSLRSFYAGKRVLVTGHTGFKGSWLSLWLLTLGAKVWGYALEPSNEKSSFSELLAYKSKSNLTTVALYHRIGDI